MIVIAGTRPEFIKLGPVVAELRALGVTPTVIGTGQHIELLRGTPAEMDMVDATWLDLTSHGDVESWLELATPALVRAMPDDAIVVVQGDTMSAMAGAQAAFYGKRTLCHVEAGVRSHNLQEPYPEERLRKQIDALSTWMYAPTSTAYANLVSEGRPANRIRLTGNTVVSALARYSDANPVPIPDNTVLITMHRREFLASRLCRATIAEIFTEAGKRPEITYVWPVHPAVLPKMSDLPVPRNVEIGPPLSYLEATRLLASSLGVLTDSGGLQEEAATLGVPCAVLRNVTDRPESIEAGVAKLFPPTPDGVRDALGAFEGMERTPTTIYGHRDAAKIIATHLATLEES